MSIQIHESRKVILAEECAKPYFQDIKQFLINKKEEGVTIYPPGSLIFNAFNLTPFDELKVVILGQDPYHGPGQAHGLCFSVPEGVKPPPSLVNMYKEMREDVLSVSSELSVDANPPQPPFDKGGRRPIPNSGNLEYLAKQGVFLLNTILTVTARQPASHKDIGRERFTDAVITTISEQKEGIVFLLRGNFARQKKSLIDTSRHVILEAAHPSPFSAHKGFFGCKHFSTTNQLLAMQGKEPIRWLS